ncbi:MAG: hypothetical protein QF535_16295 [Anaerolineales bacterium]|jgi:hypothetical protein|nr:hypothetical protein [Anaerolineales bacterium]|tara:strand:+ start:1627 stop:1872 length:246 start_codon:yes stop_codon:yes gene_type:complete
MAVLPKGLQDYSAQESVAPYVKAVVATTNTQDACRAIYVKVAGEYTLTINDADVVFTGLLAGHIYPVCTTKSSSANVVFLY